MKIALLSTALAVCAGTVVCAPAFAQKNERITVVYGDDVCPKGEDEEEIVICARKPESERYRIPERFREKEISPQNGNESWAVRAEALEYIGRSGINSCSVNGPGGWTGCYAELLRQYQAERRAARRAEGAIPRSIEDEDEGE